MQLRWDDFDLERGLLTIEPGISKTGRGRAIPLSPHLAEALDRWPRVSSCVIPSPPGSRDRARQPRAQEVAKAWREAGVPEQVWAGAPHHAFRKRFKSGMLRAGGAAGCGRLSGRARHRREPGEVRDALCSSRWWRMTWGVS